MKLILKSPYEMEELKRVQELRVDESSRRKLIKNQDTINELTARIQELQNEVDCMNDSRHLKDAESVRSGLSHVPSQPALFPLYRDPGRLLSRNDKPPDIWNTQSISGNVFANPAASSSAPCPGGIESMEFSFIRTDSLINGGEEGESNTSSRSEMPVWTVSQKFSHPW